MIILSVICVILLIIVIRLWLVMGDYQRTINEMEHELCQYGTWLRASMTWLEEEMVKRNMPDKKNEVFQFKVCKN